VFCVLCPLSCPVSATVCSDLYEGTRAAQMTDVRGIQALLQPLEEAGVLVARSRDRVSRTQARARAVPAVVPASPCPVSA